MRKGFVLIVLLALATQLGAQGRIAPEHLYKALGSPVNPKVNVSWNRYHDYQALGQLCRQMAEAYPDLCTVSSLGKSVQGRELWLLSLGNRSTGPLEQKPALYLDGNIHSNEIQASEVVLYTAWFLLESYAHNPEVKKLLDQRAFYFIPSINPDGRDHFIHKGNTPHSPRTGLKPVDDDRDGRLDEDGYDDLDGDGEITFMRRKSPKGRYRLNPDDPRMLVAAKPDEQGEYDIVGYEGIDNDGDGRINEDGPGYYDPNRDWPWGWQPDYIQYGAHTYPFSIPENRLVGDFILSHNNIAAAITYHNTGGMMLRGPGNSYDDWAYPAGDAELMTQLCKPLKDMLPGYRLLVSKDDLYKTYGTESDWMWGAKGIVAFTGELYTPYLMFHHQPKDDDYFGEMEMLLSFDKLLLLKEAFVPWKPYKHPTLGDIEIGGFKKNFTRLNPGFLLETDAHRNALFALYLAHQMPLLEIQKPEVKELGNGVYQISTWVQNHRMIPTHVEHDSKNSIELPDVVSVLGGEVLAAMQILDDSEGQVRLSPAGSNPNRFMLNNIPGMSAVRLRWLVKGKGPYIIKVESQKGGSVQLEVKL